MFDKISDAAEKVATNVSRRAFLGRLGQGALITAGVLGGMHLLAGKAQASWCRTGSGGLQFCQIWQICTARGCMPIRRPIGGVIRRTVEAKPGS
jgi:hypothetical protein